MPDMGREPTAEEVIREEAVRRVDARHGYTMEFAPSPEAHREEYDAEERIVAAEWYQPTPEYDCRGYAS